MNCPATWRPFPHFAAALALVLTGAMAPAPGQNDVPCGTSWLPGEGVVGVDRAVYAAARWDPDGSGPLPSILAFGGNFARAGKVEASRIAGYDPVTRAWSRLGSGVDGVVTALAALPNGDLVAGGFFALAGGVAVSNIARWDGSQWHPLGSGVNSSVRAVATLPNGDLVAAGYFTVAGGIAVSRIARWDGANWSALGSGTDGAISSLVVHPNGDLVAGGSFSVAGGVSANRIARWDGTSWYPLGSGMNYGVTCLTCLPGGDVIAGGDFSVAGGVQARGVARWNGAGWSPLGSGLRLVKAVLALPNGVLIASTVDHRGIAQWNGSTWQDLGSGLELDVSGNAYALATMPNGMLAAGGDFSFAGGWGVDSVALWDGTSWSPANAGTDNRVYALAALANGDLVAGGAFLTIEGVQAHHIARRSGSVWQALGQGMNGDVRSIAALPNGDLVAAGHFSQAGGVQAANIARWDGATWHALGSGTNNGIMELIVLPGGDIVIAGAFTAVGGVATSGIARWNGTSWQPIGGGIPGYVKALVRRPNGNIVAAGAFNMAGGAAANNIAEWNGSAWSPLGSGVTQSSFGSGDVIALVLRPDGRLVVGGTFDRAGGLPARLVAEWDGVGWRSLDPFMIFVADLLLLPDGDLLASGMSLLNIERYDGANWGPVAGSIAASTVDNVVGPMVAMPDGEVVIGGFFTTVGGQPSSHIARLASTCPATASSFGTPCSGSSGPLTLTAASLPWIGSSFRTSTAGFAANSLGLMTLGFTTASLPLSALHPAGVPGCDLLVDVGYAALLVPVAGVAEVSFAFPETAAIVGIELFQQVLQAELGAASAITSISGSNGLDITIGVF